jgi:hypothetical protein
VIHLHASSEDLLSRGFVVGCMSALGRDRAVSNRATFVTATPRTSSFPLHSSSAFADTDPSLN